MGGDSRVHTSDDADSRLGMNVRTLREQKGMPQAALARAMTQQGWQWHQSTVARIESGRQPLRLAEASALAQILGETVDRLTWTGPEIDEAGLVDRAASFLRMQFEETADEVAGLIAARHRTLTAAGHIELRRPPLKRWRLRVGAPRIYAGGGAL